MADDLTCGRGLAASASLSAALGRLLASMADVLDNHLRSLDASDEAAHQERQAYTRLVTAQRQVATDLRAIAEQMAGYRDLLAAPHDLAALTDRRSAAVFADFVACEQALLDLLRQRLEAERQMLADSSR